MKPRRIIAGTLAGAMLLSNLAFTSLAAVGDNNPTGDQHTTFGIMEATRNPENVQFEVPLYVTMAVVSNDGNARTPQGYNIRNTAAVGGYSIGVTSMSIEALGTWSTVATAAEVDSATKIMLSIGGCTMPAASNGTGARQVTLAGDFGTAGALTSIAPQASLSTAANGMAIAGTVQAAVRTDQKAAAQFRIRYTVAALNDAGEPLGAVYVGDDRNAAGL